MKDDAGIRELDAGDALVVVDVQRDFLPGGALPVATGRQVVEPLNRYLARFAARGLPIYASRDWHPADHGSFAERGGDFPPHCVAGTAGAEFAPELELPAGAELISKGVHPGGAAFSCFEQTGLAERLRQRGAKRLWIGGLTTEYCVRASVLDALGSGFAVVLLLDAVAALAADQGRLAIQEMRAAGAKTVTWEVLA